MEEGRIYELDRAVIRLSAAMEHIRDDIGQIKTIAETLNKRQVEYAAHEAKHHERWEAHWALHRNLAEDVKKNTGDIQAAKLNFVRILAAGGGGGAGAGLLLAIGVEIVKAYLAARP